MAMSLAVGDIFKINSCSGHQQSLGSRTNRLKDFQEYLYFNKA